MGGERETTVKASAKTASLSSQSHIIQGDRDIRIHEKAILKEVHFHDDIAKLKVAVPTATWFQAWERLRFDSQVQWIYADHKNNTLLTIEIHENTDEFARTTIEANVLVEKLESVGPAYTELAKFTEG